MTIRLGSSCGSRASRLISLLLLLAICASSAPLPVATRSAVKKDMSAPFPCQHHACGCLSAEQCWKQCCCFSHAEKLAWAAANGVNAPVEAVLAAAEERKAPKSGHRGCCSSDKAHASSGNAAQDTHDHAGGRRIDPSEDETVYVIGRLVQGCRGAGAFWHALPWAVIPAWDVLEVPVLRQAWIGPPSSALPSCFTEPPEHPPRPAAPCSAFA